MKYYIRAPKELFFKKNLPLAANIVFVVNTWYAALLITTFYTLLIASYLRKKIMFKFYEVDQESTVPKGEWIFNLGISKKGVTQSLAKNKKRGKQPMWYNAVTLITSFKFGKNQKIPNMASRYIFFKISNVTRNQKYQNAKFKPPF